MTSGTIFDLREFTVQDGPGVRQTVFFKGCPLRCRWCHNPEGLSPRPQLMVSPNGCTGCNACKIVCPTPEHCLSCGRCVAVCPQGLRRVAGETLTSGELASRILRRKDYYAALGGGVTFSGGEPLFQGEFLLETLNALPGVHKALETSGFGESSLFEKVMGQIDFLLMDVKLLDPAAHRRWTGRDNAPILQNLELVKRGSTPFIIRVPLIPGVTDTRENLEGIAALLADCPALERVELLPYHQTAGAKYAMVGMSYAPEFPVNQPAKSFPGLFEAYGIRSVCL